MASDPATGPPAVARSATPAPAATPREDTPSTDARAPALDDPVWDALVAGHLSSEVQRRLGRTLDRDTETRLVDRLRAVREAGLRLDADPGDDALAGARQRLSRSIVMLEADRAFREELGIGIAEFTSGLDPGQVDDLAAPEAGRGP